MIMSRNGTALLFAIDIAKLMGLNPLVPIIQQNMSRLTA